jgi:hypothetical protein
VDVDPPTSLIFLETAFVVYDQLYTYSTWAYEAHLGVIVQVSINSVESLLDLLLGLDDRVLLFRQRR